AAGHRHPVERLLEDDELPAGSRLRLRHPGVLDRRPSEPRPQRAIPRLPVGRPPLPDRRADDRRPDEPEPGGSRPDRPGTPDRRRAAGGTGAARNARRTGLHHVLDGPLTGPGAAAPHEGPRRQAPEDALGRWAEAGAQPGATPERASSASRPSRSQASPLSN